MNKLIRFLTFSFMLTANLWLLSEAAIGYQGEFTGIKALPATPVGYPSPSTEIKALPSTRAQAPIAGWGKPIPSQESLNLYLRDGQSLYHISSEGRPVPNMELVEKLRAYGITDLWVVQCNLDSTDGLKKAWLKSFAENMKFKFHQVDTGIRGILTAERAKKANGKMKKVYGHVDGPVKGIGKNSLAVVLGIDRQSLEFVRKNFSSKFLITVLNRQAEQIYQLNFRKFQRGERIAPTFSFSVLVHRKLFHPLSKGA